MENSEILTLARKHLADLADGKSGEELAAYFNPAIRQFEYPNLLNPHGGISDFKTLMDRAEKGKQILKSQSYDVQREFVSGNTVIFEVVWRGAFAIPIGKTPAGEEIKAFFALFIEFENGKILTQRNYDCFAPF
ncbi:MAG: nuclear transport factor 2 family protein [Saprospiraceae bacterium]|nr:nuclear transport factor 2 family protein [Candidatus Brachybacter algidus]